MNAPADMSPYFLSLNTILLTEFEESCAAAAQFSRWRAAVGLAGLCIQLRTEENQ